MVINTWNIEHGYAVFFGAFIRSDNEADLARWREKMERSTKPALEVIQDGLHIIGIVTVFNKASDVPTGVDYYVI